MLGAAFKTTNRIHFLPTNSACYLPTMLSIRIRIRVQYFKWTRIQGFDDQKWTKIQPKFFFLHVLIKNCNLLIPRPSLRTSRIQEKPSALQREHPALQTWNFLPFICFCRSFMPSRIRIRIPNPDTDPLTWLNPDPDLKHCFLPYLLNGGGLHERWGDPLLYGEDDALVRLDADGGGAQLNRLDGILHLTCRNWVTRLRKSLMGL